MTQHGYLRQPSIQGDAIVFVCDDDLWRVDAAGGTARRLTAGLGEPATPVLSPDGKWIAYVGRDEQHPEVYLMPAEGGPARRMTWLGPDVVTCREQRAHDGRTDESACAGHQHLSTVGHCVLVGNVWRRGGPKGL